MKENTKRTLVWLYDSNLTGRFLSKTQISLVSPGLSPAGLQSLLYQLEKKQIITTHIQDGLTQYSLTQHGSKLIEADFPALSGSSASWKGNWSVIVCMQAPTTDLNFRYLREYLLARQCLSLTRGVFLFPGEQLSVQIQNTLETLYPHAVVVFTGVTWAWGDERMIIGQKIQLHAVSELLSGVSKEIDRLLIEKTAINITNDQSKSLIFSLFDRLYAIIKQDSGLGSHYFTQEISARKVLAKLQLLG